jgi:hypothetical protein
MKKDNTNTWIGIAMLVSITALLFIYCHPILTIGKYQVRWDGVRHMSFTSVAGANMINGQVEKITIHRYGPITVFPGHD